MIPLQSPCVSTQMGGITGGYKILIFFTQVMQGKVPLCNPTQSSTEKYLFFIAVLPPKWVESQRGKQFQSFHSVLLL